MRIEIPETIIHDIRVLYGNTVDAEEKINEILRQFIDARAALEPTLQPGLDAHATDEEEDVFCSPNMGVFPGSPDPQGVFNPEDGVFPVEWNGNKNQNITRARPQVTFLLDAKDYPVLGRRLMNNILSVVENKNTEVKTL